MHKIPCAFTEIHKTWGADTDGVAFVQLSEICLDFMLSQADCLMALTTCFCPLFPSRIPLSSDLSFLLSVSHHFVPPHPHPHPLLSSYPILLPLSYPPSSREQQAREEGDQVSHSRVWWDRSCDRPLPPPPQPVRLSAQGQDSPGEWVSPFFFQLLRRWK